MGMKEKMGAIALALLVGGCAAQAPAQPSPDLNAGAAILKQDADHINTLGQTLQMCTNGVQQMLSLCPKVDKKLPFEKGIQACVKEAEANQKK